MKRTSLQRTILVYVGALLIVLIVAMLGFVSNRSESFVTEAIERGLQEGSARVAVAETQRLQGLRTSAGTLAAYPPLFAAIDSDVATLRDALEGFKAEGTDLLIALDAAGRLAARTDRPDTEPLPGLAGERGIFATGEGLYHFAAAAMDSTGTLRGTVIAAARLDDAFAKALAGLSESEVVIVGDRVVGSSLLPNRVPWTERRNWESSVPADGTSHTITSNGESYIARSVLLGVQGGMRPMAVMLRSYDEAIRPYRDIQFGLLLLGIGAAAVGLVGSAVLSKRVTAPVAKLVEGTRQAAEGNFDYRIDVKGADEISVLADSFNTMMIGLRERADMQKFVSQSTVDMIQSAHSKKVSAGERVTLTVLFSDMRGFTSMSENRPPEEIVRLLNECLSIQAKRVKKYGGDIDKFVGDCVVALFSGEDMELKAIRCAVEIHKALQERNVAKPDDYAIRVGVGIATGEVILGSIGSEDRLDYTVIGSTVNLCSRICSLAGPNETLMSESTYERVDGLVAAERLEPVQVKGFKAPVPLFRMAVKGAQG